MNAEETIWVTVVRLVRQETGSYLNIDFKKPTKLEDAAEYCVSQFPGWYLDSYKQKLNCGG